jgi:23S rRNA (cytosine1962-C5)-methyltransferase
MSALARIELKAGLARHLRAGHPWVFKSAIVQAPKLPPGAVVDLLEGGRFVARGYWDPLSPIAVRVLTRDPRETVDAAFFARRIDACVRARRELIDLTDTDAFRLVHGESDGLPGVVIDNYAGTAVLKLYSAGLKPHRPLLLKALESHVQAVVGRDEVDDSEDGAGRMLFGPKAPEHVTIREHGARFLVDVWRGQKTGFFLDQRENRFLVRRLAKGKSVLNCFCYTGGFSVNAALGGALSVFSVDQDADAVALARENFTLNGLAAEKHDFLAADVFELLSSFKDEGRTFDLIVLDPPAFAKSQKAVDAALDGYASLNRQALSVLKKGGLLVTASCSARVSPEQFLDAVKEAGFKAQVDLTLVEERYQPPDHPIRMQFREGRYLKFLVLQAT